MDFERHATFLFCAGRGVAKGKGAETKKDVRFAGLAASNGRRIEKLRNSCHKFRLHALLVNGCRSPRLLKELEGR